MQLYSLHLQGSMASTLGPLHQLDENLFTSRLGLRRLSMSSMVSTVSCATNPNSPTPRTPKSEDASSPTDFDENSFGEDHMRYQERRHYGQSIAPNLLSINTNRDNHGANPLNGYHSHEDILQAHKIEYIDQALPQPQLQCNQHSIVRCQDSITPFIDCSHSFTSWGSEINSQATACAMTALQCTKEEYEGFMSDEDSNHSSPSPALSYLSSSRRNQIASSPPAPVRRRRAPRRPEAVLPLVVSNQDQPHECPVTGCRRRFKRQEHLRRHERTHTLEKPFECDKCGRKFSRSDNLRAHRKTHMRQGGRNVFVPGMELQ